MFGKMTIYTCKTCGHDFSYVVQHSEGAEEKPKCPKCGETRKEKLEAGGQQG